MEKPILERWMSLLGVGGPWPRFLIGEVSQTCSPVPASKAEDPKTVGRCELQKDFLSPSLLLSAVPARSYGDGRQRPSLSMATGGESFWRIRTGGVSRGPSVPARPMSPHRCNTTDVTLADKHNKSQKDRNLNGRIEARLGRTPLSELWRKVQKQVD